MTAVTLGVNISNDPTRAIADCKVAHQLGFDYVRVSKEMDDYQQGLPDLRTIVAAALEFELKVIQCCQGMPAELARGGVAGHFGPKNDTAAAKWGDWSAECSEIVNPTGGAISILNEPDNYGWSTTPNAGDCATLHMAALDSRDRLTPGNFLITGEMAPGSNPEPLAFLEAIVAAAPIIMTDDHVWIGWHPYVDPRYAADYNASWNTNHRMRDVQAFCSTQGKPNKKIMAGEWGVATGPTGNPRALSPQGVASYVRDQYLPSFEAMQTDGVHFACLCWYTLRDGGTGDGSAADYAGLLTQAGRKKPVAAILQTYNA